jgi:hypothetical protein
MKTYRGVEVFYISALDEMKLSALQPCHFTPWGGSSVPFGLKVWWIAELV